MIKTKGILHFTLPVSDLDRSTAFFTDLLGCELLTRSSRMSFMKSGEDFFILAKSEVPISDPNAPGQTRVHHAFLVDHSAFDDTVTTLKKRGIEIMRIEHRTTGAFTGRQLYFLDPDRNAIELIAYDGPGPGF